MYSKKKKVIPVAYDFISNMECWVPAICQCHIFSAAGAMYMK